MTLDSSGVEQGVSRAESSLGGLQTAMAGAGAAAAALGGAGIAKSVSAFADFDQQLTQSTAIMGEVSSEMRDKLGKTARDVAGQLGISSDKAAESYYYLASAGLDAAESMEAMPTVAEFAAAGQLDMATATDYATDVMSAFGYEADEMTTVTDTMTATVTRHNSTMTGMGEAMSYVAPVASGLGVSIEETASAIGFMSDAGIKGSRAGTTLRQALSKLSSPTKATQKVLDRLGVSVKDNQGNMRDFSAIVRDLKSAGATTADVMEAFGTRAGPGLAVLLEKGGSAIADEADKLSKMGGVTENVAKKQLNTLNKQWDIFKTKLQNVAIVIGSTFAPAITNILKFAGRLVDRFSAINDATDGAIGKIGLLATTLGGLGLFIGTLVGGPLVGIVGALGAAGTAAAVMSGRFDGAIGTVQNLATSLGSRLRSGLNTAVSTVRRVGSAFKGAWSATFGDPRTYEMVGPLLDGVKIAIDSTLSAINALVSGNDLEFRAAWASLLESARTVIRSGIGLFQDLFQQGGFLILQTFRDAFGLPQEVYMIFRNAIIAVGNGLSAILLRIGGFNAEARAKWQAALRFFEDIAERVMPTVRRVVGAALDRIKWIVADFAIAVGTAWATLWPALQTTVENAITGLASWLTGTGIPLAQDAVGLLARQAVGAWGWIEQNILPPVNRAIGGVVTWLRGPGVSLAKSAFSFLSDQALAAFGLAKENLLPIVRTAFGGVATWLRNNGVTTAKSAVSFLSSQALAAWDFAKEDLLPKAKAGLNGVWTWIKGPGVTLGKDALSFLSNQAHAAWAFSKNDLLPKVKTGLNGVWTWIKGPGVTLAKSAFSVLSSNAKAAWRFAKNDLLPKLKGGVTGVWTWLKGPGVARGEAAFETLSRKARAAWKFAKTDLLPKLQRGMEGVWTWLRGPGTTTTQRVMRTLSERAANELKTLQQRGVPLTRRAMDRVRQTIQTKAPGIYNVLRGALDGLSQLWDVTGSKWVRTITTNFTLIKSAFRGAANAITQILRPAFTRWRQFWTQHGDDVALIVGALVATVSEIFRRLYDLVNGITRRGQAALAGLWNTFGDEIVQIVRYASDAIYSVTGGFIDGLATAIRAGMAAISGDWSTAWSEIGGYVRRIFTGILNFAGKWGGQLVSWAGGVLGDVYQAFVGFANDLIFGSLVPRMFNAILTEARNFGSSFVSAVVSLGSDALRAFENLKTGAIRRAKALKRGVFNAALRLKRRAVDQANDLKRRFVGALRNAASQARSAASRVASGVMNQIGGLGGRALRAGRAIGQSFVGGIRDFIGNARDAAGDIAGAVRDYLPGSDAKRGPLSDLSETGPGLTDEIASGIRANAGTLNSAARDAANQLATPFENASDRAASSFERAGSRIAQSSQQIATEVKKVSKAYDGVGRKENLSAIRKAIPNIKQTAPWLMNGGGGVLWGDFGDATRDKLREQFRKGRFKTGGSGAFKQISDEFSLNEYVGAARRGNSGFEGSGISPATPSLALKELLPKFAAQGGSVTMRPGSSGGGGYSGPKTGEWAGETYDTVRSGKLAGIPKGLARDMREVYRTRVKGERSWASYVRRAREYGKIDKPGNVWYEDTAVAKMASGGRLLGDGLAMLHAGEHVLNESQVDRGAAPPSGGLDEDTITRAVAAGVARGMDALSIEGGDVYLDGELLAEGMIDSLEGKARRNDRRLNPS